MAVQFRGRYHSRTEAQRAIRGYSGEASVRAVAERVTEAYEMPQVHILRARRGDVALIRRPRDYSLGIVALNGTDVITGNAAGASADRTLERGLRLASLDVKIHRSHRRRARDRPRGCRPVCSRIAGCGLPADLCGRRHPADWCWHHPVEQCGPAVAWLCSSGAESHCAVDGRLWTLKSSAEPSSISTNSATVTSTSTWSSCWQRTPAKAWTACCSISRSSN